MNKIFSYGPCRRDKSLSAFRALSGDHADLLHAIRCNSHTGYVFDNETWIAVPKHFVDDIARHLLKHGWSLGV